jgi:hypothetical protein
MNYEYEESRGAKGAVFFRYIHDTELPSEQQEKADKLNAAITKSEDPKSVRNNSESIDVKQKLKELRDRNRK